MTFRAWRQSRYLALVCAAALFAGPSFAQEFVVSSAEDSGPGTLRSAIQSAVAYDGAGFVAIQFQIPTDDPSYNAATATWTIVLNSALPPISRSMTIAAPGDARIEIVGRSQFYEAGLALTGSGIRLERLNLAEFGGAAIHITGPDAGHNLISDTRVGRPGGSGYSNQTGMLIEGSGGNEIVGCGVYRNRWHGIEVRSPDNLIRGCNFGANRGNGLHVLDAARNHIGPRSADEAGNYFYENEGSGIAVVGAESRDNVIVGNTSGMGWTTSFQWNWDDGLHIEGAVNTRVGGTEPFERNFFLWNEGYGVHLIDASGTRIIGNNIGYRSPTWFVNNRGPLGIGHGVRDTWIGGSEIAERNVMGGIFGIGSGAPIKVDSLAGTGNRIFENNYLEEFVFDLNGDGPTPNDPGDADEGPNRLQNYPEILSIRRSISANELTVVYRVDSEPQHSAYPIRVSFSPGLVDWYPEEYARAPKITVFHVDPERAYEWSGGLVASAMDANGNSSEYASRESLTTYVVSTTADSGYGSFRDAIESGNDTDTGIEKIVFSIPGEGPHLIRPEQPLPDVLNRVEIDATAELTPAGTPGVIVDGSLTPEGTSGLVLRAEGIRVSGLWLTAFTGNGIEVRRSRTTIRRCYVGLPTASGTGGIGGDGVLIADADGGEELAGTIVYENRIYDTKGPGIRIRRASGATTSIAANLIGPDTTASDATGNRPPVGLEIEDGSNVDAMLNVIGGNDVGILVHGESRNNQIANNFVGLTPGSAPFANGIGLCVNGGVENTVWSNTISGNDQHGIVVTGTARDNTIRGNRIGTDAAGLHGKPNGGDGVWIDAHPNVIGDLNTISGNAQSGIFLTGDAAGTAVTGNLIGTSTSGSRAIGNGAAGIWLEGAENAIIGHAAFRQTPPNVISGNAGPGIRLTGPDGGNHVIVGNRIGTDETGSTPLPNESGIYVEGAPGSRIGGEQWWRRNILSGNRRFGIHARGGAASGTRIFGNYVGTGANGDCGPDEPRTGNRLAGIYAEGGAGGLQIGGVEEGEGNLIGCNFGPGVGLQNDAGEGNAILGNTFFGNGAPNIDLQEEGAPAPYARFGDRVTLNDAEDADEGPNRLQNSPEIRHVSFDSSVDSLMIEYRVDASPLHAAYPLRVEFYRAMPRGDGGQFLGADVYPEEETGKYRRVALGRFSSLGPYDDVVAIATDSHGNSSEFTPHYAEMYLSAGANSRVEATGLHAALRIDSLASAAAVVIERYFSIPPDAFPSDRVPALAGSWVLRQTGGGRLNGRLCLDSKPRLWADLQLLDVEIYQQSLADAEWRRHEPAVIEGELCSEDLEGLGTYVAVAALTSLPASDGLPVLPEAIVLNPPYPNPFATSTTLAFGLPAAAHVTIELFDVLGRRAAVVEDGVRSGGMHELRLDGSKLANGVYFCRLRAGQAVRTARIVVAR